MLNMVTAALVIALSGAAQPSPDCTNVKVYFETGDANLTPGAESLVDSTYHTFTLIEDPGATATIVGHIDGDERARGLTALDEERVTAVWSRLETRRAGSDAPWTFTVSSMDDTAPARVASGREPRNRRVEIRICPMGA
ncbi:hypothetical protein GCM10009116_07300 [Brevundimonas basaltis]|uniref:Outer membrane protein OmpA-like peptidoglycan-associated protein n=1 Tax=Brevundimonas basaltis TaxID=472166 RepID=A0A7W8I0F5_9CAUL|nr:hypothetical protein [Brevundimonas basaltis]MBB5292345.1 outer membrane protein OmpA-like peptidoglycan-associated protein [Brevundimonas basaltis]